MPEKRLKPRYIYLPHKTTEPYLESLQAYIFAGLGGGREAGRETADPTPSFAKLSFPPLW